MHHLLILTCSVAFLYTLASYIKRRGAQPRLPLPPGPKGLPVLGNIKDMPSQFVWKTYHKWAQDLNTDIIYVNLAGTDIVVLDTSEAATELLERRSSIYSGRPRSVMINELMGFDFGLGFMNYGVNWRRHRRVAHQVFHPAAVRQFHPHLLRATRNLLNRILDEPKGNIVELARCMAGETVMSVVYGLETKPVDDPYVMAAQEGVHALVTAGVPGAFLVESFPILKYVPEWMPGATFKTKARKWKIVLERMVEMPFEAMKQNLASDGVNIRSLCSIGLQRANSESKDDAFTEKIISSTASNMFIAGSDTTVSAIASCVLGLLQRPDILQRAQYELDSVLPAGHLPDFNDEPNLPLITAIVKETLRWRDVVPIAIPHAVMVDDEYKGYHIPAGTIVIPNAWAMLHNPKVYPRPFEFDPDRFLKDGKLDKSVLDPAHACWGFGRRICPGRYMAFSAVWVTVASLIACFDIKKAVDEDGVIIEPLDEIVPESLVCTPKPFMSSFTPRSQSIETLIRASLNQEIL